MVNGAPRLRQPFARLNRSALWVAGLFQTPSWLNDSAVRVAENGVSVLVRTVHGRSPTQSTLWHCERLIEAKDAEKNHGNKGDSYQKSVPSGTDHEVVHKGSPSDQRHTYEFSYAANVLIGERFENSRVGGRRQKEKKCQVHRKWNLNGDKIPLANGFRAILLQAATN